VYSWDRNAGVFGQELHCGAFGQVSSKTCLDDLVFGDWEAVAIWRVELGGRVQCQSGQETASKRVVDGKMLGAIMLAGSALRSRHI
jgi:hypothetical protein